METSFGELRKKEVVNLTDGRRLGKVCDVVFTYPEGKVLGIVVPGGRGIRWGKADLFIELKRVCKVGIDVVLVDIKSAPKPEKKREKWADGTPPPPPAPSPQEPPFFRADRRDYGEYE